MDVIFETQRGEFSMEVTYWDTVLEIKEKIQKYHGIPVSKQTLIFNGQVLLDDLDVDKCVILDNSRLQLLVASSDDSSKLSADDPSTSSPAKKLRVLKQEPPSSDQPAAPPVARNPSNLRPTTPDRQLPPPPPENTNNNSDHQVLENNSNSSSDHNQASNVARPMNSPSGASNANSSGGNNGNGNGNRKMRVMVLPKSGTVKIPVEVNVMDNVGELRKELQKLNQRLHFHLPPEGYFFIYKQNVMDDDRSFRWHHVAPGDTIEIFNGSVTGGS